MAVFRVDDRYDREHGGRYAAHVAVHLNDFVETWGDIAPVSFACVAWRLAVPPALSPGYVRWHRRVLDAACVRNPYDGGLSARVTVVTPWPAALADSHVWWRDRGWRGWPELFGQFVSPSDRDLSRVPHARATLTVEAPLPLDGLPPAPEPPVPRSTTARPAGLSASTAPPGETDVADEVASAAAAAVAALVRHLDDLLGPVVARLDEPRPAAPER
jgi:hypothetical protein